MKDNLQDIIYHRVELDVTRKETMTLVVVNLPYSSER